MSKRPKGAFCARKPQRFENSVLGHMRALFPNLGIRLLDLVSKARFASDITSKSQIKQCFRTSPSSSGMQVASDTRQTFGLY